MLGHLIMPKILGFVLKNAKHTSENQKCKQTIVRTKVDQIFHETASTLRFLGPKNAPFCCKNANLPNHTCFTRIRGGVGGVRAPKMLKTRISFRLDRSFNCP